MDGPFWSFILDFAPVRRRLRREISQARDEIERAARDAVDKDRERSRAALEQSEQDIGQLRRSVGELQREVATVEADNRDLRDELAESREFERHHAELAASEARDTTSDLFCCDNPHCGTLWLLSMRPDHSYYVRDPIGPGCKTCTSGEPLLRLAAVKAGVTEPDEIARVARPISTAPDLAVDLSVPGKGRAARTDIGVKFVAELIQRDPDTAIADVLAHQASTFVRSDTDQAAPATRCAGLSAIADGLDRTPRVIRDGIAWCTTEILGLPDFPAEVLGELVSRTMTLHLAPLHALHTVAQGIRAVGAMSCIADDHLGQCQCARHLVSNVAETALAAELKQGLDRASEMPVDISRAPELEAQAPSLHDRFGSVDDQDWWHDIGNM